MPSNNPPERFYMGARMTETKPQGRARQTSCTNMHKTNLGSQLSTFDMGSFGWVVWVRVCPGEQAHIKNAKL